MPTVAIPKAFRSYKRLVAVPERMYRDVLANQRELAEVREAQADLAAGRFVVAGSIDEAMEKFRAKKLGSNY